MDNLLHHSLRVALILAGFLCALSALTFFGGVAAAVLLPYIPIIFQFIGSRQKSLVLIGWLSLFLLVGCFIVRPIKIEGFRFEELATYGALLLLLLAGVHLWVSDSRKNRTNESKF
ncbi:MAG: hypothetical protein V4640_15840 [Verrucomicrobiota bacterium]